MLSSSAPTLKIPMATSFVAAAFLGSAVASALETGE